MLEPSNNHQLPPIPSKHYFKIGEVSELCAVKPHVLRYWEQEFTQLEPIKRNGNRRYYRRADVILIRQIAALREQGMTIDGIRRRLDGSNVQQDSRKSAQIIRQLLVELEALHELLK